jgi:c-di-AMP phosphodiesterase-like protein
MENFVTNYILPLLGSAVATLLTILLTLLISWLKKKTGLEIQQAETDRLIRNIEEAVRAAEEMVRAQVKAGMPSWTSEMKYKWVLDYIGNKFPHLTEEEAGKKINAVLARLRVEDACCLPETPPSLPAGNNWVISNTIPPNVGV